MTDLLARIDTLSPEQAVRVLTTIARARVAGGADGPTPDAALADALTATGTAPDAMASAGDVAKAALRLLAEDPALAAPLDAMLANPPAESFTDAVTLTVGLAALVVLQSYVKVERDKAGKWSLKFEKRPLSDALLSQLIAKLGGWLKGGGAAK